MILYFLKWTLHLERKSQSNARFYIRKRADNTRVKKELQEFANDFEVMKNESVDAKWNMFQQRLTGIMTIMDCCMPHKFITSRHNLPGFNRSLRWQTTKKQKLYNRGKKSGRQSDWNKCKLNRKQLHKNLSRSRSNYLSDVLRGLHKLEMKCLLSRELRLLQYFEQRRNGGYLRPWQKSYSDYWNYSNLWNRNAT